MRYVLAVVLTLLSSVAMAWNATGHKLVASIAFRQLSPERQTAIVDILKKHPRFEQDFKSKLPADITDANEQNEWYFQQMAAWPDIVKGFHGADAKYNHGVWHYIDNPVYLTPEDKTLAVHFNLKLDPPEKPQDDMNVIQAIRLARKMLADKATPDEDKAVMLCWVFHDVGDIHQPLHSSALMATKLYPEGDKGGNGIKTGQRGNLHSLWDGFLGNGSSFRTVHNRAIAVGDDADKTKIGTDAAKQLDEKTWMDESHAIAENVVYDSEVTGYLRGHAGENSAPPIQLTERYLKDGGAVAEKRVIEGGYRLGAVLKQVADSQK